MIKILDKYELPHEQGKFGAIRKYDIHTGVDLYCEPNSNVYAIEDGIVIGIEFFTGENAGSPWWNETECVLVEGSSGVIVYGEIATAVRLHEWIGQGELIGNVKTVLKKDKGLPMTMLHVELYKNKTKDTCSWPLNTPQPDNLLDVTIMLKRKKIL